MEISFREILITENNTAKTVYVVVQFFFSFLHMNSLSYIKIKKNKGIKKKI